jgi:hypothetical protein
MPSFRIENPQGVWMIVEGERAPTNEEAAGLWAQHVASKDPVAKQAAASQARLAQLGSMPPLPTPSLGGQVLEAFSRPPKWVEDLKPESAPGLYGKALLETVSNPQTISMALPFGLALKAASTVGKTAPLMGDFIRAATLAPMVSQAIQGGVGNANTLTRQYLEGAPAKEMAPVAAEGTMNALMTLPLLEGAPRPTPSGITPADLRPTLESINADLRDRGFGQPPAAIAPFVPSPLTPSPFAGGKVMPNVSAGWQSHIAPKLVPDVEALRPVTAPMEAPFKTEMPATAKPAAVTRTLMDAEAADLRHSFLPWLKPQDRQALVKRYVDTGDIAGVMEQAKQLRQQAIDAQVAEAKKGKTDATLQVTQQSGNKPAAVKVGQGKTVGTETKAQGKVSPPVGQGSGGARGGNVQGTQRVLTPEALTTRPALRTKGGGMFVGEQGVTHDQLLAKHGLRDSQVERGFVDAAGKWMGRTEAAERTGLPTQKEAGKLHSQDLPGAVQQLNPTAGQPPTYPLSSSVHPGKMVDSQGRTVDPRTHRTTGESGFVMIPPTVWQKLGFQGGTKIDAGQMMNRLKNVLGDSSEAFKWLQQAGLSGFLSERRSADELRSWVEANGPKVEVRKFGEGAQTPEQREYNKLNHWWDTKSGQWPTHTRLAYAKYIRGEGIEPNTNLSIPWTPTERAKLERYKELTSKLGEGKGGESAHWSFVAPKAEKDMPGYVEIAVVKPVKGVGYGKESVHQFPSSHHFPPNTLGFVRGYMETVNGEKVFHVIEVQSDWAQRQRAMKEKLNVTPPEGWSNEKQQAEIDKGNDPLLTQYNRLALKAAVEHARAEGAKKIVVSDAETAMMTEGHDVNHGITTSPEFTTKAQAEAWAASHGGGKVVGFDNAWAVEQYGVIPQEQGMRLNYDTILPKIAEELTGSKGERVELGKHKNAFEPYGTYEAMTVPRKNLIFRNPDGTPKTSVTGRMYDIPSALEPARDFSFFGKDKFVGPVDLTEPRGNKGEAGFIINIAPDIMDALRKGKDMVTALFDQPSVKAGILGFQRYSYPQTEARSPVVANKLAEFANSRTASELRAHANINKVFGDKVKDEQFLKQFGGIVYEDMRLASGGTGTPVLALRNSPFSSAAQLQAAMANPEMQAALARWKTEIQAPAEKMHKALGGELADVGQATGAFANLKAVLRDATGNVVEDPEYSGLTTGPMATLRKGSAFSKERKFSGDEYDLNAANMAFRMMTRNWAENKKLEVYKALEDAGMGKLLKPGEDAPAGMTVLKNPVSRRTLMIKDATGKMVTVEQSRRLAVDPKLVSEFNQAFQLDTRWGDWLERNHPVLNKVNQFVINTQVAAGIDFAVHSMNDYVAVLTSPKGLAKSDAVSRAVTSASEFAKTRAQVVAESPAVVEELAKMAEKGVSFRGRQDGWSANQLRITDTATRLILNREYDDLVAKGTVKDTPAERRRYVSGRAGEYNKRFMTWFQQGMQETGIGAFNVAGRNFNRLAVGNMLMAPGVKGASASEALRLRLSMAVGLATAALVLPTAVNTATTGSPTANGQVEPWQMYLGKADDGRARVLDMTKLTLLNRAGRATGAGAVMEQQVMPRLRGEQPAAIGQTLREGGVEALRTMAGPFAGPPVNMASTLLTGKSALGYEQRAPGEKGPPYLGAALGAANPLVGPVTGYGAEGAKGTSTTKRTLEKLGSLVGVKEAASPKAIVSNLRRQFLYKIGKAKEADYAPSEYKQLLAVLPTGDKDAIGSAYKQLLEMKAKANSTAADPVAEAKKDIEMYFKRYAKSHGSGNSNEDEAAFVKQLTPHQKELYAKMMEEQARVSENYFAIYGKQPKKPRGFGGFGKF